MLEPRHPFSRSLMVLNTAWWWYHFSLPERAGLLPD